mmetsp:Transcript_1909/g.2895  ORF Transcript_1909/g.2895 Transcript_1909/m.2895 type:complete len:305 (-) Transcript_1909:4273-5187(-)
MPPKNKQKEGKKTQEKKKDKIVEDKTFGLKNKNKSKQVQKYVKSVEKQIKQNSVSEKLKEQKKQQRQIRIQQEQELKALFSEGLSISIKKSDLRKKKEKASELRSMGAGGGGSGNKTDHYDDAWAEAELAKAGEIMQNANDEPTLEQRIEQQREEMRKQGKTGTPVTQETFAAWKARKAQRIHEAKEAALRAEQLKKKGGKGLSILSGKDLWAMDNTLFVDDADGDAVQYDPSEQNQNDNENYYQDTRVISSTTDYLTSERTHPHHEEEATPPSVQIADPSAVGDASLYLDADDNLDDLDDLDD